MRVSTKEMHIIKEYEYPLNLFNIAYVDRIGKIEFGLKYNDKVGERLKYLVKEMGEKYQYTTQIIELRCKDKYTYKRIGSLLGKQG